MRNRIIRLLLIAVSAIMPQLLLAQTNTINTFSSYSMYGLGELQTQGTILTRSMGGAGVALRSRTAINLLNPASYSIALRKGILFDFALEGGNYLANQEINGQRYKSTYATANIHDIAVQVPIAKGLGFGVSVTPFSSTGYYQVSLEVTDSFDFVQFVNDGSGDVAEIKLGVGWEIAKGFSIGLAAQYYWGDLDRAFSSVIINFLTPGTSVAAAGVDNISVSKIKGQLGAQWIPIETEERQLVLGATFDIGGDLTPRHARVVTATSGYTTVYAQSDTTRMSLVLPRQLEFGASYTNDKFMFAADYSFQNWGSVNDDVELTTSGMTVAYNNVHQVRLGVEYIPRRIDVRKYMNRVGYRAGFRYGGYQYTYEGEKISQMALTAGMGFPINMIGISKIELGFEWGRVGSKKYIESLNVGLVQENHLKFSLGFTLFGDDYWFQRQQID
ncbi:MAG: hypothetical protein SNF68_01175 [Rikenellaceae bacterium]